MTPDFSRSTQTLVLIEALRVVPIGQVLSYGQLTSVINQNVQGPARHYLYSAMKVLQGEGIAFGTVRGQGVKRLTAEEIPGIGDAAILHIRRSSRRARKRMGVVSSMNDVPNETRIKVNALASLLGAIDHFSSGQSLVKVAKETATHGPLPPMKLLEALK